jgi:hypothetical protein
MLDHNPSLQSPTSTATTRPDGGHQLPMGDPSMMVNHENVTTWREFGGQLTPDQFKDLAEQQAYWQLDEADPYLVSEARTNAEFNVAAFSHLALPLVVPGVHAYLAEGEDLDPTKESSWLIFQTETGRWYRQFERACREAWELCAVTHMVRQYADGQVEHLLVITAGRPDGETDSLYLNSAEASQLVDALIALAFEVDFAEKLSQALQDRAAARFIQQDQQHG